MRKRGASPSPARHAPLRIEMMRRRYTRGMPSTHAQLFGLAICCTGVNRQFVRSSEGLTSKNSALQMAGNGAAAADATVAMRRCAFFLNYSRTARHAHETLRSDQKTRPQGMHSYIVCDACLVSRRQKTVDDIIAVATVAAAAAAAAARLLLLLWSLWSLL